MCVRARMQAGGQEGMRVGMHACAYKYVLNAGFKYGKLESKVHLP